MAKKMDAQKIYIRIYVTFREKQHVEFVRRPSEAKWGENFVGYIVEFYYRGTNFRKKRASLEDAIRLINLRVFNFFFFFSFVNFYR